MERKVEPIDFSFCTLRIYDASFAERLSESYKKIGGSKNAFIASLVKAGYDSNETTAKASLKAVRKAERKAEKRDRDELELFLRNSSKAEYSALMKIIDKLTDIHSILSRIYGIELMKVSDAAKDAIESGVYDRNPFASKEGSRHD